MSAFALHMIEFFDSEPCGFPGCKLKAYHEGNHQFAPKKEIQWSYDRHCVVCGISFIVFGADKSMIFDTCGSQQCMLHYARRHPFAVPLLCHCPQREYPHDLSVHAEIRSEWFAHRKQPSWPWSLMLSVREEPSTERKFDGNR